MRVQPEAHAEDERAARDRNKDAIMYIHLVSRCAWKRIIWWMSNTLLLRQGSSLSLWPSAEQRLSTGDDGTQPRAPASTARRSRHRYPAQSWVMSRGRDSMASMAQLWLIASGFAEEIPYWVRCFFWSKLNANLSVIKLWLTRQRGRGANECSVIHQIV